MKNTLFISYDGLSDPLGQSQILPYLKLISNFNHKLFVVTNEKKEKIKSHKKNIKKFLELNNITWKNLLYSKNNNKLYRLFDLIKMFFYYVYLINIYKINIVHIRGFLPAIPILYLSYFMKFKIIYDSRGLWVDERIDNGSIRIENIFHKIIYKILKKIETKIFYKSDSIIVLTRKAKRIITNNFNISKIIIIPCCADYNYFQYLKDIKAKENIKNKLNLPINKNVLLYSGSLKGVYLFQEMINFFENLNSINNSFIFVVVTNDLSYAKNQLKKCNSQKNIYIFNGSREDMPNFYCIADALLCFIKSTYARKCSSPTKIAEALASNIPLICNTGVGDINLIIRKLKSGILINLNQDKIESSFETEILKLINNNTSSRIRDESQKYFDLECAYSKYSTVYNKFLS